MIILPIVITTSFVLSIFLVSSNSSFFVHSQTFNSSQNVTSPIHIPNTISKEAQEILRNLAINSSTLIVPSPDDIQGWQNLNQQTSSLFVNLSQPILDRYQYNITSTKLGDVNVLDVKPENWIDNGKVLVYVHGGGYTVLGANSTLANVVPIANITGLRIISLDYSLAPYSKWNQTTDEVISAIQALVKEQGYGMDDIAIYGDSAGGGLVAGSVLKMQDKGLGIPAAIVLWSPWADVTGKGDTYVTLKTSDPFSSYNLTLKNMAGAYVNQADQENPYVSPVYGNFSKGFSPTLIQGGTKEILLSDFIRLYQALDQSGIPVKLDIYEGMPHVFQSILWGTPEYNIAISKMTSFLKEHLKY